MTDLPERFSAPAGWQWGYITPRANQTLRYGWCAPKGATRLCVIFPGLSEYGEKYFEVAHDLVGRNFAVAVIDWRGQGLSWRHLGTPEKRHHDDFALDVEDGIALLSELAAIPALASLPRMVLAHSMGGHIALRLLHDQTSAFRCAVTTAPMFGINLPFHMAGPARMTAEAACRMGWAERYIVGAGAWSMSVFTNNLNLLSSDTDRRSVMKHWVQANPDLRMGGLTFGWIRAALASTRLTHDPTWLSAIETPVLAFISGREMIVSNTDIEKGMKALATGETVYVDGALHEVLMERDVFRARFWTGFDSFIAKHMGPR